MRQSIRERLSKETLSQQISLPGGNRYSKIRLRSHEVPDWP